jgi:hypothetical protein
MPRKRKNSDSDNGLHQIETKRREPSPVKYEETMAYKGTVDKGWTPQSGGAAPFPVEHAGRPE